MISWVMVLSLMSVIYVCYSTDTPMTPDDIIEICSEGKSNSDIISEIQNRGIGFEVNLSVMQKLIDNGVSPGILEVVLSVSNRKTPKYGVSYAPSQLTNPGLTIVTNPPGMTIYIDDEKVGITPYMSNKLALGKHTIRAMHPLFFPKIKEIELQGSQSAYEVWDMEPREPIIRVRVQVTSPDEDYPWSWIVRSREQCPDEVTLSLAPWKDAFGKQEEAVFILSDDNKRIFKGSGSTCLELFLWRGEVRRDLPIRELPPCTARYFISNIRIKGMEIVDILVKVEVDKIDPTQPKVTLETTSGYLIETQDKTAPTDPQTLRNETLEKLDTLLK